MYRWCAMLCSTLLCYAMLCYAMRCDAMLSGITTPYVLYVTKSNLKRWIKRYCKNDALSYENCLHSDGVISCFHSLFSTRLFVFIQIWISYASMHRWYFPNTSSVRRVLSSPKTITWKISEMLPAVNVKIWPNKFCLNEHFIAFTRNVYCQQMIVLTSERV